MTWIRHVGAFAGGASQGLRGGVNMKGEMQRQDLERAADQRAADYYGKLSQEFDDWINKRGAWAADEPTRQSAPVVTPPAPSMNPEDAGPPASIGGGDARTLMTRALPAVAQQPPPEASPLTPGKTASAPRSLPFFQFLGG